MWTRRVGGVGLRVCVQVGGVVEDLVLERLGAQQAAGDAREDARDVTGAEGAHDGGEVHGFAVLGERGGEFLAIVDQLADEAKEAAGAGGDVRLGHGGGRGG